MGKPAQVGKKPVHSVGWCTLSCPSRLVRWKWVKFLYPYQYNLLHVRSFRTQLFVFFDTGLEAWHPRKDSLLPFFKNQPQCHLFFEAVSGLLRTPPPHYLLFLCCWLKTFFFSSSAPICQSTHDPLSVSSVLPFFTVWRKDGRILRVKDSGSPNVPT